MGRRAATVVAIAAIATACSLALPSPPPRTPPPFAVAIQTADGPAGLVRTVSGLDLYVGVDGGSGGPVTGVARASPPTVHLLTFGGETRRFTNSFVFGYAPVGSAAVVVNDVRQPVVDGLYLVALPDSDIPADALSWRFLGPTDAVVLEGRGVLTK